MANVHIQGTPVAQLTDDEIRRWMLGQCRQVGRRIKPDTLPVWLAALRAFASGGTPATVRQMFYALTVLAVIAKTEQGYMLRLALIARSARNRTPVLAHNH